MEKYEDKEKRAVGRLERKVTVHYKVEQGPPLEGTQVFLEETVDITQTKDLSEKGIFLTVSRSIPAQTILELRLRLPTQREQVELTGRVVSCKESKKGIIYGLGVEFINLDDRQRRKLRYFMQLFLKGKGK